MECGQRRVLHPRTIWVFSNLNSLRISILSPAYQSDRVALGRSRPDSTDGSAQYASQTMTP